MELSMKNSSTHGQRLFSTGRENDWTNRDLSEIYTAGTTVDESLSTSYDSSFRHSITTDNEADGNQWNTYSITTFRMVWVVLAITMAMLLSVAIATVTVRYRHTLMRRRSKKPKNTVTFRFTRSSNLTFDKTRNTKSSPTSSREVLGNAIEIHAPVAEPSTFAGTNNAKTAATTTGAQCPALESDLYEKDSDSGSCHLECTTFSAVNDNFDDNKLNRP